MLGQVCNECRESKEECKDLRSLQFGLQNLCKVETKGGRVSVEISTVKQNPGTLDWSNSKDAFEGF